MQTTPKPSPTEVIGKPHITRTAPLCKDCKHYVLRRGMKPACYHPGQPVHLDTGGPWVDPYTARSEEHECAKRELFFCGLSGLGFNPNGA